jgi:hypothetical protein
MKKALEELQEEETHASLDNNSGTQQLIRLPETIA